MFLLPDSARIDAFFPGGAAFNNVGTLRKTNPGGMASVAVPLNNNGLVEVQAGALAVNAAYTQLAGSTILDAGTDLVATGGVQINGGELNRG